MKMSKYEQFLEHTCGTSGVAITSSSKTRPKSVTSYRRVVLAVFNYDTLIHTKNVCLTCR